jgi:hypothetical protein
MVGCFLSRKGLFWLTVSEVSAHDHLAPLLLGPHLVRQRFLADRNQEDTGRGHGFLIILAFWCITIIPLMLSHRSGHQEPLPATQPASL